MMHLNSGTLPTQDREGRCRGFDALCRGNWVGWWWSWHVPTSGTKLGRRHAPFPLDGTKSLWAGRDGRWWGGWEGGGSIWSCLSEWIQCMIFKSNHMLNSKWYSKKNQTLVLRLCSNQWSSNQIKSNTCIEMCDLQIKAIRFILFYLHLNLCKFIHDWTMAWEPQAFVYQHMLEVPHHRQSFQM